MSAEVDVVIIGAGAAGLSAAKEAERLSLTHTLVEASERIGGRAFSEEIAPGVFFDHGCSWLHQAEINPFVAIADKLGFRLGREFGDPLHAYMEKDVHLWRDGRARDKGDASEYWRYVTQCEEAMQGAIDAGRDLAIADVMDLGSREAAPFLYFLAAIHARDAEFISLADYMDGGEGLDWPVRETYGALVKRWGSDVEVSLDTCVERIDWSGKGVRVETSNGIVHGRSALITTSTGVLAAGDLAFAPQLPSWKIEAIHGLPTGCVNKIALHFDRDVWGPEQRGFYVTEDEEREPAGFDLNRFGDPLAVVFTGGRFAEELEREGQSASEEYAISRLVEVLGSDIRRHLTRAIATAWRGNPWTRGAYSCALPGRADQRTELARSIDQRLFFAGEATINRHQSSCHGAYLSGIRAIGEITATLHAKS